MSMLHAELVALRIGHHDPRPVVALADIDVSGSQFFESGNLCGLVLRSKVEMQAILDRFGLRHLDEQQVCHDAVVASPGGWLDDPLRIFVPTDHPIQCRCPKSGQPSGISRIDGYCTNTQPHEATIDR